MTSVVEGAQAKQTSLAATAVWLSEGARSATTTEALLDELCRRFRAGGLPVYRVAVFIRTLHPNRMGRMWLWREGADVEAMDAPFDTVRSEAFAISPVSRVIESGRFIRRRICAPDCPRDFPILADLEAEGVTDYIAAPLIFTDGETNVTTLTTRQEGGFRPTEIAEFEHLLLPLLARVAEARTLRRLAINLLDAYVGHDAGEKILAGKIKRGDLETLRAAIWLSDMRGFTKLADRAPPERVIERLNAFFDCLAPPIESRGGYVLKFMGDGLLAIFPAYSGLDHEARLRALAAARQASQNVRAFNASERVEADGELRFGLALHFGEALYGNIGGGSRLDFTCIGPAINLAARIEKIAARLGRAIVASRAFAAPLGDEFESLGAFELTGFLAPQELYGLPGGG